MNRASPAGSRGRRTTWRVRGVGAGRGPAAVAPAGTAGWPPTETSGGAAAPATVPAPGPTATAAPAATIETSAAVRAQRRGLG